MTQSFNSIIKEKTGFSLDEIFEGFKYSGKKGDLFVFSSEELDIQLNIDAVRNGIKEKVFEKEMNELKLALSTKGIFKISFDIINFSMQRKVPYTVSKASCDSDYILLIDENQNTRDVHYSLLQDEQTKDLLCEIRQIERDFDKLSLNYVLKSIKRICEQVFHPANQSSRANDIHATLLRLKILILEKLEDSDFDISEFTIDELQELKEEISFSINLVDPSNTRLLSEFNKAIKSIDRQIVGLEIQEELNSLNEENFLEIFEINKLKSKLVYDLSKQENNEEVFSENYFRIHQTVESKTGISFKNPSQEIFDFNGLIDNLYILQTKFVNSQLKVGHQDSDLLIRFNVIKKDTKNCYPILQDYNGITEKERMELHKELVEHRLLLLFQMGITDEYFKELARINVNDFYRIFYGIK